MATTKVNSEFIAVNAISGTIIADGAITSTHLAANCVDSSELVTGSIDTIHIAANQVTSAKIVSNGVLTRHISDDQVTGDKLTNNITIAGTLTSTGAFTSPGIDDNADAIAITIDSSENVGIGTTSPDRKLDVSGTGNVYGKFQSTNATGAGIEVKDTGEDWLIQADDGTGSGGLAFYDLGRTAYRMFLDASGNLGIGTTSPSQKLDVNGTVELNNLTVGGAQGSDGQVLTSTGSGVAWEDAAGGVDGITSSADATAITIDSSERIGIPAIGQVNVLGTIIPYVSVNGQNADQAHINIHRHRAAALAGYLSFSKSRSATKDFTIVQDDDPFGTIDFQGADGNQFQQGAQIQSYVDGTPGAGTMPGRLVFKTTTSSGPVERMRIDSAGSVSIGDTDGDYESRNGSKGLHVKRGGILMNGPAGDANMSSATDANQWTYHAQGGRGGNFTSVYFSVPNPNGGASGQGYGGFSVEFYIAGYNAKYHSGHYSGYTNNGIVQSASAFYATSGSSSIAAVSVGSQGFKITVSFPSMTHPTAKFVVNKGGHGHNSRWTDMSGAQIGWA